MDAAAAAQLVGLSGKSGMQKWRVFARADELVSQYAPGSGGKWTIPDDLAETMIKRYAIWSTNRKELNRPVRKPVDIPAGEAIKIAPIDMDPSRMPVDILNPGNRLSRATRAARDRLSHERVQRLEAALMARGLHISQLEYRADRAVIGYNRKVSA